MALQLYRLQTLWEHNKMSMLNLVASLVKLKHAKNLLLPSLTSSGSKIGE
ncbi:hypothetical protein LguiA_021884 [Lonicera macranthoides]